MMDWLLAAAIVLVLSSAVFAAVALRLDGHAERGRRAKQAGPRLFFQVFGTELEAVIPTGPNGTLTAEELERVTANNRKLLAARPTLAAKGLVARKEKPVEVLDLRELPSDRCMVHECDHAPYHDLIFRSTVTHELVRGKVCHAHYLMAAEPAYRDAMKLRL